jgi:hypothetical protein
LICAASLFIASNAHAFTVPWEGTLTLDLGSLGRGFDTGTGLANVGFDNGGVSTLQIQPAPGLSVDQTIGTTPATIGTIASVRAENVAPSGALFQQLSVHPLFNGKLPLPGILRFCFVAGCGTSLAVDLVPSPSLGVGIGGTFTAVPTGTGTGPTNVVMRAAPWQIAAATLNETPDGESPMTFMDAGFLSTTPFMHTTGSGTAPPPDATVLSGSVIQLISPTQISATGDSGTDEIGLFSSLKLEFVPEPGMFVLLISGVVTLAAIGRTRGN